MNNQLSIGRNFAKPDRNLSEKKKKGSETETLKKTTKRKSTQGFLEEKLHQELNKSVQQEALQEEVKKRFLKDLDWRISHRPKIWRFTAIFFTIQNLITFTIVGLSLFIKPAFDLTTVLSIIVPVSLGTTAYTLKEVTKFLFKEVDYGQYLIENLKNNDSNIYNNELKGPPPK